MSATTTAPASTKSVARKLVDLCRANQSREAIDTLYSDKIVTIESMGSPEMPAEQKGIEAVRAKHKWWSETMTVHSTKVSDPMIGDDEFAVYLEYDTTHKPSGKRSTMREMARYTVKDGKIVREEFFYKTT